MGQGLSLEGSSVCWIVCLVVGSISSDDHYNSIANQLSIKKDAAYDE